MTLEPVGVVHGRFQPLHLGHMEFLLAAKDRCDRLVVGITNPDPGQTREDQTDRHRSTMDANPFTYYDRLQMVEGALVSAGVKRESFAVVPFPINIPSLIVCYAPEEALYFLTIYDDWGRAKLITLQSLGLRVEVLWERGLEERFTTGTEVRRRIRSGEPWYHLVPAEVAAVIEGSRHHTMRVRTTDAE